MKRSNFEIIVCLIFSLCIVSLPWESLWETAHGYKFIDRDTYRIGFLSSSLRLDYSYPVGVFGYFTDEFLWYYSVKTLLLCGIDIEFIFTLISLSCIFSFSLILKKSVHIYSLIFLVNPLVIDLAFSQLRLALAISILFFSYLTKQRFLKYILVLFALFIHTSSIIFLFLFIATSFISKNKNFFRMNNKAFIYTLIILTSLSFAIALGPLREIILFYIGDRRVEYPDMASSWFYGSFWIALLCFGMFQNRNFFNNYLNSYATGILALAFFNITFGTYFSRFIAAAFPVIIIYMLSLSRGFRLIAICLFLPYALAQWLFWVGMV